MAKIKHVVNGDQQSGWYCYQCLFSTRDVELAAAHDGMKIYTSNTFPPIPCRQFDWAAWDDNLGADCSPIGRGSTEQQAINDLTEQLAEKGQIQTVGLVKVSEEMARENLEREKSMMRCCENGMLDRPHECRKKSDTGVTASIKSEPEYPSFFRCVDALCAACGGAVSGCEPVCFMPPFGWIHVWTKGNGHMKCAAANLWEIAPNKEARTR